jgi:hypothetical protein
VTSEDELASAVKRLESPIFWHASPGSALKAVVRWADLCLVLGALAVARDACTTGKEQADGPSA